MNRHATKKEILKAYRKLAVKWHPDQFQDPQEKKKAEVKFIDIAAAKEVLTDQGRHWSFLLIIAAWFSLTFISYTLLSFHFFLFLLFINYFHSWLSLFVHKFVPVNCFLSSNLSFFPNWFVFFSSFFSIEKRAKFDQGEDPLDPEQQGGGGGWPFQGGGFPFGAGNGYQFKFHFN